MVEVFKTNVEEEGQAQLILQKLQPLFPEMKINFDLNDCDKILRVQGRDISIEKIITLLKEFGFMCLVLE